MREAEGDGEQRKEVPNAIEVKGKVPNWYRGDLNGAYQRWREGGRPADPEHPLTKGLLDEARLFADRSTAKARLRSAHSLARLEVANEKSIQRAMILYDPDRKGAASFTTYIKRSVLNNIRDELRHQKNPKHQAELLRAHNGDRVFAHWWVDEEREERDGNSLELVIYHKVAPTDRPLAHWLLDQDPQTKITWRHVLAAFPDYKTEDTAGRALRRVKKAIEKDRFYRF
jgi:hypothetical protein